MAVTKGALSPDQPTLSQGTTVAKKADVPVPHDIEWGFDIQGILGSTRKVRGTFHVPKTDKDNEIITAGAMDAAMEDYMHLPIISEYHKERPIGIVLKSWKTLDGKYQFEGVFKSTTDCDDVWEKVQKGEYDMLSIAGKRTEASEECSTHPLLRGQGRPCVTKGLRLDSISACDDGARNDETSLEMVKAKGECDPYLCTTTLELTQVKDTLIKGTDSNSPLVHQTFDGTKKRTDQMPKKCSGKPPELQKSEEETSESEEEKKKEDEESEEKKAEGEPAEDEEKKAEMGSGMEKVLKAIQEMHSTLKDLVASDKEVHSKIGKADDAPMIGPVQKAEEKSKDEDSTVTKAALIDPAEFKKAMDTIAEMDAKIKALEAMPAGKDVVVIKSIVEDDDVLESDATAIIKSTKEGKKK
jgi:hypothetical protein